jgi:hypothetical protein
MYWSKRDLVLADEFTENETKSDNKLPRKTSEAGLWFLTAAIHYNKLHFCDGNLNQFKNIVRNTKWDKKDILTKKFRKLWNIF